MNSNGYADVLVSPQSGDYVELFLSNGNGTYQTARKIAIPNAGVIAVGDFNKDGHPDLINSDVYVLLGDGKGDFGKPKYFPVASSPYYFGWASQVFLVDTRNIGRLDLITTNELNGFSVLLNNGSGSFKDGVVTQVSNSPSCGISADFNGDGKPDVALSTDSGISILFGTGNPATPFDPGLETAVSSATCAVEGDLNGDGISDLLIPVLAAVPATTASWYSHLGNGDGTFRQNGVSVNPDYGWMVLADFNLDGKLDYANASNFLALGNGDGTFQTPQPFVPFIEPDTLSFYSIVAGDLNGDGYPDLLLTDVTHQYLYVLLNNQQGGWNETVLHVPGQSCDMPEAEVIADVNGDGLPDAVLACIGFGGATIFTNQGGGALAYFATVGSYTSSEGTSVTVADVNGDGIPDLEIYSDLTMAICLGDGGGKFAQPFFVGTGPDPGRQIQINLSGQAARAGFSDFVFPDATGRVLTIVNTAK